MMESNQKSNQKILLLIQQNPAISIRELQDLTGLSESGVKKVIRQLKTNGRLLRSGGAKGGHWVVVDNYCLNA
jgi:ATP-dependent DNA helicase RecG